MTALPSSRIRRLVRITALALACLILQQSLSSCRQEKSVFPEDTEAMLRRIDSTIERRAEFERERNERITEAYYGTTAAGDDSALYDNLGKLYYAYAGYRLDSALNVAQRRLETARRTGVEQNITEATITLAQSLMSSGEYLRSIAVLDTLPVASYGPQMREKIYSTYFGACDAMAQASPIASERAEARLRAQAFRDSVIALMEPNTIGHTYLTASRMKDRGMTPQAIELLEQAHQRPDVRDNAAFQYGLGLMYLDSNRDSDAVRAIAQASILDLQDGKKEYISLIRLARVLYDKGEILRAFNYIKCAFEDASFSHTAIRTNEIMEFMPIIDGAYRAYESSERQRVQRNSAIAAAFGLLMAVAMAVLWSQLRRISKIKRLLAKSNSELSLRNKLLARADNAKVSHIEGLLELHASSIANNKNYRRELLRMMAAGQYTRVQDRLKSDNVDNTDTKLFYELFDATFLSMFPDFIGEINAYMREPFAMLHPVSLTPEQRIMALMKFGHSSTADISAMLQYSQQTVYNYRSSIRSMLACSLDDFERKIRIGTDKNV
ncbi:MAG: hypothetical protein K2L96_07865 [Muribaculaceae bacterium]|nr:hypothetical protein [Muribaculaceae bacterium]